MSNFFDNLSDSTQLEQQTDSLGGSRYVFPSDIYNAIVKQAYLTQAKSGARALTIILGIQDKEYSETIYFTNREGKNSYTKDGKTYGLPGFNLLNAISFLCCGKEFKQAGKDSCEEKVVNIYNFDIKKEVPTSVPVIMDWIGKPIAVALIDQLVNKQEKNGQGEYRAVDETREENRISAVFSPDTHKTYTETKNDTEAKFCHEWLKKYKTGEPYNRVKKTGIAPSSNNNPSEPKKVDKVDESSLFS